jgi:uncharacterized protein (DUF58 family)
VNTGNNLLFLIDGAMLGFMSITGIIGLGNIRNLQLSIHVPDEIYAGLPTQLTVKLRCRGGLFPAYLLQLILCGRSIDVPVLNRGEGATAHLMVTFDHRGRGGIDTPHVLSPFPIGFFVRSLPLPVATDFIVFPAPLRPTLETDDAGRRSRGETELPRAGSGGDLYSINDYTGRESLRQVHWRLSARHDTLKVKQYGAAAGTPVVVDLAQLQGTTETRLGVATHLINRLHRSGRAVGLKIGGETIPPAHGRAHRLRLLKELALHDSP